MKRSHTPFQRRVQVIQHRNTYISKHPHFILNENKKLMACSNFCTQQNGPNFQYWETDLLIRFDGLSQRRWSLHINSSPFTKIVPEFSRSSCTWHETHATEQNYTLKASNANLRAWSQIFFSKKLNYQKLESIHTNMWILFRTYKNEEDNVINKIIRINYKEYEARGSDGRGDAIMGVLCNLEHGFGRTRKMNRMGRASGQFFLW